MTATAQATTRRASAKVFVRPLLHTVHLVTFVVLFATGLLLFVPELRAWTTGGYSLFIRRLHFWTGAASIVLPLAVLLRFGAASLRQATHGKSLRSMLKGAHFAITVAITVLFAVTGLVIWPADFPYESLVDASRTAHGWLTYVAAALLTLHLGQVAVAATIARMTPAGDRLGEDPLP